MEWKRSHRCGELDERSIGLEVVLMGWVQGSRDHGGLLFIDLRDSTGIIQLVFSPEYSQKIHSLAQQIRSEYVIGVKGKIGARPSGTINPSLSTGRIEILAEDLEIINEARPLPFVIEDDIDISEQIRLRYRYLDLRRPRMQSHLILRHKVCQAIRGYLSQQGFIEIETPMLIKSTPEGARDYLVPSRLNPAYFYALPQSPQMLKQILMIAGFDRYFQTARCFRDEDLRADRQPEFTQVDLEMSFASEEDIISITEGLMREVFQKVLGQEIRVPFTRLTYDDALSHYGNDKPDLRYGMEIIDFSDLAEVSRVEIFHRVLKNSGRIKGICVNRGTDFSRKDLDEFNTLVISRGARGLVWSRVTAGGLESPIAKYLEPSLQRHLQEKAKAQVGDLLLMVADSPQVVNEVLGFLRSYIAERLKLVDSRVFKFVWVTDFPMFTYNEDSKKYEPEHHPFTSPREKDLPLLDTDPGKVKARSYDLVLNGVEIGSGSIRIHRKELQEKIFRIIGISPEEAKERFGFFLEALDYGAPPHCGIAPGLDRIVMLMAGCDSIREVIAFPKTQKAACPLTGAPSAVDPRQLKELHIKLDV